MNIDYPYRVSVLASHMLPYIINDTYDQHWCRYQYEKVFRVIIEVRPNHGTMYHYEFKTEDEATYFKILFL